MSDIRNGTAKEKSSFSEAACREGVSVQSHQVGRCCAAGYHQTAWLTDSESHSLMDVPEGRSTVCKRNRRSSGRRVEWLLIFGVQDTHSKYGSTDELYVLRKHVIIFSNGACVHRS